MAYTLVKLNVREIKETVSIGAHDYSLVPGVVPISIDGLSQIGDSLTPSTDEWSYFPDTNVLKVNTSIEQDLYIVFSILCCNYESAYYAALDPTDDFATKYKWLPVLVNNPAVSESGRNILEGIISYNSLSVSIATSTANGLSKYFGSSFSVMNQDFSLWRITNAGTILKIYTGIGTDITSNGINITYGAKPKIKLLDEPAYYGLLSYNLFYKNGGYINNPYVSGIDANKNDVPLLCASILPNTIKSYGGGAVGLYKGIHSFGGEKLAHRHFDKNTLVKCKAEHEGTKFKFFAGIVFNDFNESDYTPSTLPTSYDTINPYSSADFADKAPLTDPYFQSKGYYVTLNILSTSATYDLQPNDWGLISNSYQEPVYSRFYQNKSGTTYKVYCNTKDIKPESSDNVTPKGRFKMLFTNNEKLNLISSFTGYEDIDENDVFDATTDVSKNMPRLLGYDLFTPYNLQPQDLYEQKSPNNGARLLMMEANLGSSSDIKSDNTIGSIYKDLQSQPAGDVGAFDYFLHWQIPVGHASLSMQSWLTTTLKAAFQIDAVDISELDFNESMQMVETTGQSYRELLEKMLPSIGCFVSYDHVNQVPKIIKINPTKPAVGTLTESDFWGLKIKLDTQDTYFSVAFRNDSLFQGENTMDLFKDSYTLNPVVLSNNNLNNTKKEKIIPMLTMETQRANEIAAWHHDNKFIYNWETAAEDGYLNIKLGDMVYLESDLIIEQTSQAKIMITKRTINEDKISFEGIKFASIN